MREITLTEVENVSGGGPLGFAAGGLGTAGAILGALALIAAPEIAIPLGIAAGVYGGLAGCLAMVDAV